MANIVVDALGKACPLPVVMTLKALKEMKECGTLEVQVDNEIAVQNVTRLAEKHGYSITAEKKNDQLFVVTMDVNDLSKVGAVSEENVACEMDARGNYVVAVDGGEMGRGDAVLGKTLIKGFIFAVSQLPKLPATMLFYNGGASLTCEGSDSLEDLKNMEAQGVEILTCGTCLDFYGLKDKLAVGGVTNMYTIVEKLSEASKVIKP